jgi:hypothetical protein
MQGQTLEERVDILERTVEGVAGLPARVEKLEVQVSQLRTEMRDEFSATRQELREGDEETRRQMHILHDELIDRIEGGDEETRRRMRILHEEVISRIKILGEALGAGAVSGRRSRKKR